MKSISENFLNEQMVNKQVSSFFKENRVGRVLKESNAYKSKGVPVVEVFMYLIQLVFTKKSMYMNILNGTNLGKFGKDVVYRFLNSSFINWTTFLLRLSSAIILNIASLTGEKRLNAIIADDTVFERSRSKKVELLANVHDHAAKGKNKYKRGFRLLALTWTDGVTTIPMLFRHLSSKDKKNRYNEINPEIDKRSVGYKARRQAVSSATDVLLSMLEQSKRICVPAKHVLFDSWFSFPATMMKIQQIGFDAVGRLKDTHKIKYLYNGMKQTLNQIYRSQPKRRGKAKYLLSVQVLLYNDKNETTPARIVFVRDRNSRKKWIAFGTTDMALSEEEIIQLYGKRWDIEVFFKICKSYLNLAGEFQGLSYDCITAHTTVVMTRYIILAVDKRQNEDMRSMGELFHLYYDEMPDIKFSDALAMIHKLLCETLSECLFLSNEEISEIIDRFIEKIAVCFKCIFPPPGAVA